MNSNITTDIKRRVSYKKKISNDFERAKDIIDLYAEYYVDSNRQEKIDKLNINYDLLNGRLDIKLYDEPICVMIDGEKVKLEDSAVSHYPLIAQIANSIYGEQIMRPFKPVAKDIGESSLTLRSKKFNELLRELIDNRINNPIRDEVTNSFLAQMRNNPNVQLSPDQIEQMQSQIEQTIKSKTPEEIIDFMVNDFRTPMQRGAQRLLDYFVNHLNIKSVRDESFRHALAAGETIIYVGDEHDEPVFKMVNPKHFKWGGSQNTEWYQKGTWCTYTEWLTVPDAQQEFAEYLADLSTEELSSFIEPIGGFRDIGNPEKDNVQRQIMIDLSQEDSYLAKKYEDVNYKTKKGQRQIVELYSDIIAKYGGEYGKDFANYGIRKVHVCWRDLRKMKRVTRLENGEEVKYWFDEHYEEQPQDLKVIEIWVNEIWEGTKIGRSSGESIYVNIRPIPNQFPSKYSPFGTDLPYYGKAFNSLMNNSKNVAWVDPGKTWQKDFDVTMAQLKHDLKTNMGTLFLVFMDLKPDGWKYQDWLNAAKDTGFLLSTLQKHGRGVVDPNLLKPINIDRTAAIAAKIQLLDYQRTNLIQALNYNDARVGSIGQYSTNQNAQQNQVASYNQTEGYFETHRQIIEKALNALMNRAKYLYKHNNKRFLILDDISRTELEISPDFWYENYAIEITTSADEIRKVEALKANLINFIQNQMSFDGVLALALADTTSDVVDIMKKESKRIENIRQESMQMQQQQFQAQLQSVKEEKQAEQATRITIEREKLASQERNTVLNQDVLRRQADADLDGRADVLEKAEMELMIKKMIEDRKADLKEKELGLKEKEINVNSGIKHKEINSSEKIAQKQIEKQTKK